MPALPFLLSLLLAALLLAPLMRSLRRRGALAPNYRGRELPRPTGALIVGAGLPTVIALTLLPGITGLPAIPRVAAPVATYVLGVALLGSIDDLATRSGAGPRGIRAHLRTLAGRPSTGVIKAAGTLVLAAYAVLAPGSPLAGGGATRGVAAALVAIALFTVAPHVFNLLDVRPGRAIKGLLLLVAPLILAARHPVPAVILGPFLAPVLLLLPVDLREHGMLGDTGASAIGAIAGASLVLTLPALAQGLALLAAGLVATYGERRSITALVERRPILRQLDSLGRCG